MVLPAGHLVTFQCGAAKLSWLSLLAAVDGLQAKAYLYGRYQQAMRVQKYLIIMLLARKFPEMQAELEAKPGDTVTKPYMSHVLIHARSKACSDPKDRVFALYGVFEELGFKVPRPDYAMSVEYIFREATVAAIENDKDITVLAQAPSDHRNPQLPSWVPDWNDVGWQGADSRGAVLRDRFCASGPADPRWNITADHRALTLSGSLIDTIIVRGTALDTGLDAALLESMTNLSKPLMRMLGSYRVCREWTEMAGRLVQYPSGEPVKNALKRTLVSDYPKAIGQSGFSQSFEDWYQVMTTQSQSERLFSNSVLSSIINGVGAGFARYSNEAQGLHAIFTSKSVTYNSLVLSFSNKKCLFVTQRGYMGTAPDMIRAGDRIAVVAGMPMPLILRPADDNTLKLVSHAYVHGAMYGEAWPEDAAELEEIILV